MSAHDLLPAYAELHCLSNYSFLRGASHPEELVERARGQGYAALALTDECSLAGAVRAHMAAKDAGLPLILGSEITLVDGTRLVLLAHNRGSYGDLSQLITRGRRNATKGSYRLTRDDVATLASSCLALWLPAFGPCEGLSGRADAMPVPWLREVFAGRAWVGAELLAEAGDSARLARFHVLSRTSGLTLVAAGDVHMHVRARRALQDTLTAVRLKTPVAACGHALHPNGERHLRSRARLAGIYPPALLAETLAIAERCRFSLDDLRYEYPQEIVPPGETAASWLRSLVETGLASRYPEPGTVNPGRITFFKSKNVIRPGLWSGQRARADRARARADRRAGLRAVLPHRPRHRCIRALEEHPVPGTRLGRQFRRLLCARHHRGRSGAQCDAVRALHQPRAQ